MGPDTVHYYFREWLGWQGEASLVDAREFTAFKSVPGFNNDVHIIKTLILFYLWKAKRHQTTQLDLLAKLTPSISEFRAKLKQMGGGLAAASAFVKESGTPAISPELLQFDVAEHYFHENYVGSQRLQELTGRKPRFHVKEPYFMRERIIVDPSLFPPALPFGIITGRNTYEVRLVREHLGLSEAILPWEHVVCADSEYTKPHPKALRGLASRLGAETVLYFGDTMDDLQMVQRYQKERHNNDPVCWFGGITKGLASIEKLFATNKVPLIASQVNAILRLLDIPNTSLGSA